MAGGGIFMSKNEAVTLRILEDFRSGLISRKEDATLMGCSERSVTRRVEKIRRRDCVGIKHGNQTCVRWIGVTSDLKRRIYHHKRCLIAGFTRKYHVHLLVYFERLPDMVEARSREKKLKGVCRARKDAMICAENPEWRDLYEEFIYSAK